MAISVSTQEPLFRKIRRQLLLSNVLVFALVLGGFAIAIRTTFTYNLRQQQTQQLRALARGALALVEVEQDGTLEIDSYETSSQVLVSPTQGVEWLDLQGQVLDQLGDVHPAAPLETRTEINHYTDPAPIQSLTLTVASEGQPIAYIRANQSLAPYNVTVEQFDLGLGIGVLVALSISGIGGLWLNRQAMRPIESSFNQLRQFTADASHELRNPIMAITSNAEVALKYDDGMRQDDKETLNVIVNAAEQMTHLTQDLLLLSRLDKQVATETTQINLTELLENLIRLYRPQADEKQITLKAQVQPNLVIEGNTSMLIRAFTNLIQNALRYTLNQGSVAIKGWQKADQLWVSIEDNGVGIAPENIDKIFDRFWRADKARTHASGGSGLGLSITQAIIQNHGGTIEVQSQVDQGSRFIVCLMRKGET